MLDCVYLLNKGCSLLPCVMGVITNILQACTCCFPSTWLQHWEMVREMTGTGVEFTQTPTLLSHPLWVPYEIWSCRF